LALRAKYVALDSGIKHIYKVHFKKFKLLGITDFVYLEDLKNKREMLFTKPIDEAKNNNYFIVG